MRPPISPRSADGKANSFLLRTSRSALAKSVVGSGGEHTISKSKDVVSRNDEVIVEVKRSSTLNSRIGWRSMKKNKDQQRQPYQELRQQLKDEERQPPPKQIEINVTQKGSKPIDAADTPTMTAALTPGEQRPSKKPSTLGKGVITPDSGANGMPSKYIPLRRRVMERERKHRHRTARTHNDARATKIATDDKVTGCSIQNKTSNVDTPTNNMKAKAKEEEEKDSKSPHHEEVVIENKTTSDDKCLDAKGSFFSAVIAFMSGAAPAYFTTAEDSQATHTPTVPMETSTTGTAKPDGGQPCPSEHGNSSDLRASTQSKVVPMDMGHGCCRLELDEDETSDSFDCKQTSTNVNQDTITAGSILTGLDSKSLTETTLKGTNEAMVSNAHTVFQPQETMKSTRDPKRGKEPMQVENHKSAPVETEQVIQLKRAIADAQEREKLYLSNQRFMEEKISSLERELDAERKIVRDQEKEFKKRASVEVEEKHAPPPNNIESERKLVCQEKEVKKPSGLLGDLQKKVNQTLERVTSRPREAGHVRDGSLSELDLALQSSSTSDEGSELDVESDGNSSLSSAPGLAVSTQGVIGNISLVDMPTSTEEDIELALKVNCSEDMDDVSTRSKSDCSSGSLSGGKHGGWMQEMQEILTPLSSEANDESISSSFTDYDSVGGKRAAWRWFRFRSKELRKSQGAEGIPTSLDAQNENGMYDTSTEDEVSYSNSFESSYNSASASMDTETSAETDFQNTISSRSNSCYSTSSELDRNGSSSSKSIDEQINLSPGNGDKIESAKLARFESGLGPLVV